jgi:hypothetical protein
MWVASKKNKKERSINTEAMDDIRRYFQMATAAMSAGFLTALLTRARKMTPRQRSVLIAPTCVALVDLAFYLLVLINSTGILEVPWIMGMSSVVHLFSLVTVVVLSLIVVKFVR